MTLLFGKYTFACTLSRDAILPEFKGSTFRGVFGRALKDTVCALRHQECGQCLLKEKCLYCVTFETHLLDFEHDTGQPIRPHPFVINPPLSTQRYYPKGSGFEFDLLLFGPVNDSLPYFVYAFDHMGKIGMGRKIDGLRGTFQVDHVRQNGTIIYSADDGTLKPEPPTHLSIPLNGTKPYPDQTVTVTLVTPLRLIYKNNLYNKLPFHILVRAMLRRASFLYDCYGTQTPAFNYKDMVAKAETIQTINSDIHWQSFKRYSSRQNTQMTFGGITGSITYQGDLEPFLPLMAFCQQVNIGKQTAFGLGRLKYKIVETIDIVNVNQENP